MLATYTLQQDEGVHLGTIIDVPFYSPSQLSAYNNATGAPPKPTGPTVALRVVGFEATEFDFPSGSTPAYSLYAFPAFGRTVLPRLATGYVYFVRLHHGAADLPRFDAATSALGGTAFTQNADSQVASVEASIHPQAIGWWLLAALAALVGLAVIGQALGRQSTTESEDFPTMAALGIERRQLIMLGTARNLMVGLAGALGALAIATVLSPIAPLGEARVAEGSRGITFDTLVLPLGALVTVVAVLALGFWPAVRAARALADPTSGSSTPRPSKVAGQCGRTGHRRASVIGVRMRDRATKRPERACRWAMHLVGTVLAVIALCGTAVFGASLSHLTATPGLYGDPFQLNISDPNGGGTPDLALLKSLEHDRAVTAITQGIALPAISIDKAVVGAIAGTAIRRATAPVDGGLICSPRGAGQVGLGATTMREVNARVGSVVHVTVSLASRRQTNRAVRSRRPDVLPVLGNAVSLGAGAVFTLAGYQDAACPPGRRTACRGGCGAIEPMAGCWPVSYRARESRPPSTATSTTDTGRSRAWP